MGRSDRLSYAAEFRAGLNPAATNASIEPATGKPCAHHTALMLCPYFAIMACICCLAFTGLQSEYTVSSTLMPGYCENTSCAAASRSALTLDPTWPASMMTLPLPCNFSTIHCAHTRPIIASEPVTNETKLSDEMRRSTITTGMPWFHRTPGDNGVECRFLRIRAMTISRSTPREIKS